MLALRQTFVLKPPDFALLILVCLLFPGRACWASVTFAGNDLSTGAHWRTPCTLKENDVDKDNVYGSVGYYLAAGERFGYVAPFLKDTPVITGNPDEVAKVPPYIVSLAFSDPVERGSSWGGEDGNFGRLDLVSGSSGLT